MTCHGAGLPTLLLPETQRTADGVSEGSWPPGSPQPGFCSPLSEPSVLVPWLQSCPLRPLLTFLKGGVYYCQLSMTGSEGDIHWMQAGRGELRSSSSAQAHASHLPGIHYKCWICSYICRNDLCLAPSNLPPLYPVSNPYPYKQGSGKCYLHILKRRLMVGWRWNVAQKQEMGSSLGLSNSFCRDLWSHVTLEGRRGILLLFHPFL